jgi:hypothetical protein
MLFVVSQQATLEAGFFIILLAAALIGLGLVGLYYKRLKESDTKRSFP